MRAEITYTARQCGISEALVRKVLLTFYRLSTYRQRISPVGPAIEETLSAAGLELFALEGNTSDI